MILSKKIKLITLGLVTAFGVSVVATPVAMASNNATAVQQDTQAREASAMQNRKDRQFYYALTQQVQTTQYNGQAVRVLSDDQVDATMKQVYGYTDRQLNAMDGIKSSAPMVVKAGVNKVVFHGKKKKGNFDLYLSKKTMNRIRSAGIGAGISIIAAITGAFPGVGWAASYAIKKIIATMVVNAGPKFKHGRVYYSRKFKPAGWRYQ